MPRERVELFRESKTKEKERIIVLAFEGNITEEEYFQEVKSSSLFNDELVYLHLLKRPKSDTNSAPKHVFNKLKREAKEEFNFNPADELWMIIDKDRWKNIDEIIELCRIQKNMFVAVSNPCFEFWLLLHICKMSSLTLKQKADILANLKISNKRNYTDELLGDLIGDGYNKKKPRTERFMEFVSHAIVEAKKLVVVGEDYPLGLGSYVFKVMEKIIR